LVVAFLTVPVRDWEKADVVKRRVMRARVISLRTLAFRVR
jgi:hypothetical protein